MDRLTIDGTRLVAEMSDDEFEIVTRALVPFAYGAFEQHGSELRPFEPGKPNANAYNAVRAVLAALGELELKWRCEGGSLNAA